ncbi:hypothetical protein FISHEDRAFT_73058 [Fistulina hepatica ATCC 64428]|uniref:Uncharacterized protein n=1 Tax=Fistulina hepatica ATCC 64428 TaxID=1128425 RepID=A0A0D7ADF2_9AGAR|nr:hypothetical protein FISHEDRAFT_73058 [Fistulina hepatica ATCC 64428]
MAPLVQRAIYTSTGSRRTWYNSAGTQVGTSATDPITVNSDGLIIDPLDANHGLMNQESQTVDSNGLIHTIISYVPGRFMQCVTDYETDRIEYGHAFHLHEWENGTFSKMEIPFFIDAVGRSQIVLDANDNAYVVMPYVCIVTASAASSWTDWTMVYNGTAQGLNVFGEITVDRARLSTGILSILYQESTTGSSSPVHVIDFELLG